MCPEPGVPITNADDAQEAADPDRCSDAELIGRMQADDLDAFEAFFKRHRSLIFRTAYGLTGDRQAAEEVLQDTFARAYWHRGALRRDVSPVPWLHRVALNLCYSRLDRRRIEARPIDQATDALLGDGSAGPAERAEQAELQLIVRQGIAALPVKHRSVVVLYYLDGLSLQETATMLDVRLGTVKSRLHYALRGLRDQLEGDHRFERERGSVRPADELEAPGA
ncbi:MAG: RNA polymerase sigma factor [Chloroflexota bacterium]|nr:RNA polymerase sigma factor [Chloroflexota bacterium]